MHETSDRKRFLPKSQFVERLWQTLAYLGTNRVNKFHYQIVGLNEIIVYQNGLPIVCCLVSTTDNKQLNYKKVEALDFVFNKSHGISLANNHNHYFIALDLTLLRRLHMTLLVLN